MTRNRSPTDADIQRWAEAISDPNITDIDTFETHWEDFFSEESYIRNDSSLKTRTFNRLRQLRPDIALERKRRRIRKQKGLPPTTTKKFERKEKPKRVFKITGKIKGKIVKAERTFVTVRNKAQLRYRDKKGRFVKVKRK